MNVQLSQCGNTSGESASSEALATAFVSAAMKPWCRLSILIQRIKWEVHLTVQQPAPKIHEGNLEEFSPKSHFSEQKGRCSGHQKQHIE